MENNECLNCKAYTKCLLAALRGEQIKCIHFLHIMDDINIDSGSERTTRERIRKQCGKASKSTKI